MIYQNAKWSHDLNPGIPEFIAFVQAFTSSELSFMVFVVLGVGSMLWRCWARSVPLNYPPDNVLAPFISYSNWYSALVELKERSSLVTERTFCCCCCEWRCKNIDLPTDCELVCRETLRKLRLLAILICSNHCLLYFLTKTVHLGFGLFLRQGLMV